MAFKLSVVSSAPNLQRGSDYHTVTSGTVASGQATIGISGTEAPERWLKGDIIKIGPSTDSTDVSKFEYKKVLTRSTTQIVVDSNLDNAYASGDPVSGVGSGLPNGWQLNADSTPDSELIVLGHKPKIGIDGTVAGGFLNNLNALWFQTNTGSTGGYSLVFRVKGDTFFPSLTSGGPTIKYRIGIYYWVEGAVSTGSAQYGLDNNVAEIGGITLNNTPEGEWIKAEAVGDLIQFSGDHWFRLAIPFGYAISERFGLGLIYLTHASMTTGDSAGVYSFPVDPVSVSEGVDERITRVRSNFSKLQIGNFEANPARGYSLKFIDANESMLRQLEVFQYWQDRGNLLMLESDIANDRPVFGIMKYDLAYEHWDLNRVTLQFNFAGV